MIKDYSKPAFPSHGSMGEVVCEGMSLRDYFAAKAMQGIMANADLLVEIAARAKEVNIESHTMIAKNAYEMADEMLEAREI